LADLDPGLFAHCRWFIAQRGAGHETLGLHFAGLEPNAYLTFGEADGLPGILEAGPRTSEVYFIARPEHEGAFRERYEALSRHDMLRMAMSPKDFAPAPGPAIRLDMDDLARLQALYGHGDVYGFSGYQLAGGVFFGIEQESELVAAAGTHVVSTDYGVAVVGNVFTHPDHRRRGYGSICTGAVTGALLDMGLDVVLNVHATNQGAIRVYESLGYLTHCPFIEILGRRR
jgi:ribosomal protein S18 acetylase RimI-like enzyme